MIFSRGEAVTTDNELAFRDSEQFLGRGTICGRFGKPTDH